MHKLILSTFLFVCVFANKEPEPDAKPSLINIHEIDKDDAYVNEKISEESRIVQDVYSPDYYEPNIILDYRYLKTGGRRYTRGDGGQILIIPKRNQLPNTYNDYDSLLEYLRLKRQSELNKVMLDSRKRGKNGYTQHLDTVNGLYEVVGDGLQGWDDNQWSRNKG